MSVDKNFPERGRTYNNRERSSGSWLLKITIFLHVSPPVKIQDLINEINHPSAPVALTNEITTPPENFLVSLENALGLCAEDSKPTTFGTIDVGEFMAVVFATAKKTGVAGEDIEAWASAVWVR